MTKSTDYFIFKMFEENPEKYNDESFDIDFDVIDKYADNLGYKYDGENDVYVKK